MIEPSGSATRPFPHMLRTEDPSPRIGELIDDADAVVKKIHRHLAERLPVHRSAGKEEAMRTARMFADEAAQLHAPALDVGEPRRFRGTVDYRQIFGEELVGVRRSLVLQLQRHARHGRAERVDHLADLFHFDHDRRSAFCLPC